MFQSVAVGWANTDKFRQFGVSKTMLPHRLHFLAVIRLYLFEQQFNIFSSIFEPFL
jgi:hypothetical protein